MNINSTRISQYIKEYTTGEPIILQDVFEEIKELFVEIIKANKKGIKEEFEDVLHFLQLYLYWRFNIDEKIWKITENSVQKFINRRKVWNEIYVYVGLPKNVSGYAGNYKRKEKVIKHLQKFGTDELKAEDVYRKIVLKNNQ